MISSTIVSRTFHATLQTDSHQLASVHRACQECQLQAELLGLNRHNSWCRLPGGR